MHVIAMLGANSPTCSNVASRLWTQIFTCAQDTYYAFIERAIKDFESKVDKDSAPKIKRDNMLSKDLVVAYTLCCLSVCEQQLQHN